MSEVAFGGILIIFHQTGKKTGVFLWRALGGLVSPKLPTFSYLYGNTETSEILVLVTLEGN